MSNHRKKRSQMCREEVEHSAEWSVSKELAKVNKLLGGLCLASNILWAVVVLILVFIR
jgi:hypothetical protein